MTPWNLPDESPSPVDERRLREAALDETIEASFPASDPPSSIPNPADRSAIVRTRRPRPVAGAAVASRPRK